MRLYLLLFLFFTSLYVGAQNKQLLYNVDDLPQTLMSNPGASVSFEKHFGIPLLSGLSIEASSSGVSFYDIFREDRDINESIDRAITELDEKDYFGINQQIEILSFGWKSQFSEVYFSGGLYQELDAILYYPKDFVSFAYRGNVDFIDVPANFSQIAATAEAVSVYHFGVNKKVNDKLQVGARGKIYMSIFNINSTDNSGSFITQTTPDGPNFFRHSIRNGNLRANTSGLTFLFDEGEGIEGGDFLKRALISSNIGLGIDLGVTYFANDHWTLTGSIVDLGFISHSKDVKNYSASGSVDVDGIEFEFPAIIDGTQPTNLWEELEDEVLDQLELEGDLSESYITTRPVKVNGSVQYAFGRPRAEVCNCLSNGKGPFINKLGVQVYGIGRPQGIQAAATAFYDRKWSSFLRSKIAYTVDRRSQTNIGMLLSTQIHNFNLYIAGDNLLEYSNITKARGASIQLGMQLIFNSK